MWIIFVVITVVLLGSLVALSRKDQIDVSGIDQSKIQPASATSGNIADHVYGTTSQKVTLIEYGDFQCPACGSAYPIVKAVTEEYKDTVTFIFRNNPLTSLHPNARAAAAAAEAAGLQGKYWEMHDLLYTNQNSWSQLSSEKRGTAFDSYAKQAGVKDMAKFKSDMDSKNVTEKINFDLALGKTIPVQGTPTILLNGKQIESEVWSNKDALQKKIDEALKN
jgi:protein-disulfide isomerase